MITLPTGLLLAGVGLLALGFGVVLLLGTMKRQDLRQGRVLTIAGPHWPAGVTALTRRDPLRGLRESRMVARLAAVMGLRLEQAGDYPVRWWVVPLLALPIARAGVGMLALLGGDVLLFALPLLWLMLCRASFNWLDARRMETLFRQFPDALGMVTRTVRVGIPVSEAIRIVGREAPKETAAQFNRIADRLSIGLPIEQALAETAHRNGVPEYRFFATALALQNQTGGGLGETLENLAEVIRKRVALKERGYALAGEARTSAGILGALPFVTTALLAVLNPPYILVLFTDPGGQRILAAAMGLLLVGILMMRTMIKRSLS